MHRRAFMATTAGAALTAPAAAATGGASTAADGQIPELAFDSAASLLNANGEPLADESIAAVWAGENATNTDQDGNGDATAYPDSADVPLVAVDGDVVGFGGMMVDNERNRQYGNEEFVLNAWDEHVGEGRVVFDNGHGQFYNLEKFATFASYAEDNGYTVKGTKTLAKDLSGADAAVITSPSKSLSDAELGALKEFVDGGGALFLHDQSDFRDYDQTANLNAVADHLGLAFRFNDDQVIDEVQNGGKNFKPVTDRFTDVAEPYLDDRDGLGLDPSKTYSVEVTEVLDGDTVKVTFEDGRQENIRVLGVDTAEKKRNQQYERIQEWEGIESLDYLASQAAEATQFAKDTLGGSTVELFFDENESVRDVFGRVLGYIRYDDGKRSRLYNRQLIAQGHARVYGSGLSKHDDFRSVEEQARRQGKGLWAKSDPPASSVVRNGEFSELFVPTPASVKTIWGEVGDDRVPLYAADTAEQDVDGGDSWWGGWFDGVVEYEDDIPLAAVDETARTAMVGSPLISEDYEKSEDYPVDTSGYGNFPFLTNLIDYLSDREGDVAIEGGHGQFSAAFSLSNEDAAYYQRYLEGLGMAFEQFNDVTRSKLEGYRGVIVTTPTESFDYWTADALESFARDGGAVVLLGAGTATGEARGHLNDLARRIGTDLRLNADKVRDESNNLNDDPSVITTGNFDDSFPLFSPYQLRGACGRASAQSTQTGQLSGEGDDTAFAYAAQTARPCETRVVMEGPDDTDFDLYVTLDGRTPTPYDYDRRSYNHGSFEKVVIDGEEFDGSSNLGILVHSYAGSGQFALAVQEFGAKGKKK